VRTLHQVDTLGHQAKALLGRGPSRIIRTQEVTASHPTLLHDLQAPQDPSEGLQELDGILAEQAPTDQVRGHPEFHQSRCTGVDRRGDAGILEGVRGPGQSDIQGQRHIPVHGDAQTLEQFQGALSQGGDPGVSGQLDLDGSLQVGRPNPGTDFGAGLSHAQIRRVSPRRRLGTPAVQSRQETHQGLRDRLITKNRHLPTQRLQAPAQGFQTAQDLPLSAASGHQQDPGSPGQFPADPRGCLDGHRASLPACGCGVSVLETRKSKRLKKTFSTWGSN